MKIRRCAWCDVTLSRPRRWWARHCRRDAMAFSDAGLYLQGSSPYPMDSMTGKVEPSWWTETRGRWARARERRRAAR